MGGFAKKWSEAILAGKQDVNAYSLVYAYEKEVSERHKKKNGVFYTPTYIVDYIVSNTLTFDKIKDKIQIIDPACGSGVFLLGAFNYILDYYKSQNLTIEAKKELLKTHIFGIDIDKAAVNVTKLVLFLKILENEQVNVIKQELINFSPDSFLRNNILEGNALIDFEHLDNSFDIVIGNPPWVSLSGRFGNDILNEKAHQYLIQKYHGNTYMPNLYEYFVHRGLDLIKEGGLFSFIVPDRLGFNQQFVSLRKRILENYIIEELLYKAHFPNIVTDTLIFRFLNQKPTRDTYLLVGEFNKSKQEKKQLAYLQNDGLQFNYQKNNEYDVLIEHLFSHIACEPLINVTEVTSGFGGKSELITKERQNNKQIAVYRGRSIQRYKVVEKYYFEFEKENITGRTTDKKKLGASEKVLMRKTGIPLFAAYDNSGIFPEQSLYFIFNPKNNLSLKYLTALINSKLFNFLYVNVLVTNKDSTPQIKKVDLDKFPVRMIDAQNAKDKKIYDDIINGVEMIMNLHTKLQENLTDTQRTQWEKQIVYYENQINDLILDLYNITHQTDRKLILQY